MRVEMADPAKVKLRGPLRLGGFLGFIGGFLLAYQRSSSTSFSFLLTDLFIERTLRILILNTQ